MLKKKLTSKLLAIAASAAMISSISMPLANVSARADGYYYQGCYITNVSEYLTLRAEASTSSKDIAHIPSGTTFCVLKVENGYMGYIEYEYRDNNGRVRIQNGYVNLKYALENYRADGKGVVDKVPNRYRNITLRSSDSVYSSALDNTYLPTGTRRQRGDYSNNDRRMTKVSYNGKTGWINLDYTEFVCNL